MRCIKNAFWEKLLPYLFAPCWITGRDAVRSRPVENVHTFQTTQASWRCRQGRSTKETIVVMRVVAFEWYTKYNCVLLYRCADLITHLSLIIPIPTAVFCTWCTPLPSIQMQDQISPRPENMQATVTVLWKIWRETPLFFLWKMQKQNLSLSTRDIHFTTRSAFNFEAKNLWAYLRPPNNFLVIASNKRPRNKKIFAAVWRAERHTTGL